MSDRGWRWLSCGLLIVIAAIAAVTARDYGVTWDEENRKIYGELVLNWYSSFFSDDAAVNQWRLFAYGGFFDAIAQLVARLSPHGVYETRHAVNTVFGLLGILCAFGVGSRLAGRAGGFFSALFLATTPVYYGHMFTNPKDIPFAALSLLTLYFALLTFDTLPSPPRRYLVALGTAAGLTLAVRIGGILLLGYVALLWGGWLASRHLTHSLPASCSFATAVRRLGFSFGLVILTAWATMLVWWPWAQVSPIMHPLDALMMTADFDWPLTVFYKGAVLEAKNPPIGYLPTWFAISLPEFYFVALLAGCLLASTCLRRVSWTLDRLDWVLKIGTITLAASLPVAVAIVLHSTLYDGIRQFLFVVPCLAVLAGTGAALFIDSGVSPLVRIGFAALVFSSVALTVFDMAELHPYEHIFFNRSVAGGFEAASSHFETDYYGSSYREGTRWLIENYHPETTEKIRVANPSKSFLTAYYLEMSDELRQRFVPVQLGDDPHIYISTTRWNKHEVEGKVLHVVSRKGVPLLYVIELRAPS